MAALTNDRLIPAYNDLPVPQLINLPVAASVLIYAGAMVSWDGTGLRPARVNLGDVPIGRARERYDNSSGLVGAINADVEFGIFRWDNSAAGVDLLDNTFIGKNCYVVDDHTVAATSAGGTRIVAGVVLFTDSAGVWVLPPALGTPSALAAEPKTLQTGTLTLASGTKTINTGITVDAASKIFLQMVTPGGGGNGVQYKLTAVTVGAPSTGAFTVTAVDAATGATVATDVSVLNYLIVG